MGVTGVKTLFTRQSSGLVREVSVVNALFFNTAAFIGGTLGGAFSIAVLAGVPIVLFGSLSNWTVTAVVTGGRASLGMAMTWTPMPTTLQHSSKNSI